jgi:hypothetical protein
MSGSRWNSAVEGVKAFLDIGYKNNSSDTVTLI